MKIESSNDVLLGNNTNAPTQFRIAESSKAFKILSSNLYKNKILAVVRELVFNAKDSHILAKSTTPMDIHIPTVNDPRFIVRDYGVGLSNKDVIELYTTYFGSTKSESNDFTGGLGIGSKSPFAYTDGFTVTSYFDGMEMRYNAVIENGVPQIYPISSVPTEEPNGMKIIVPARENDISGWEREIAQILRTFDPSEFKLSYDMHIQFLLDENFNGDYYCTSTTDKGVYALYGGILYPIIPNWNPSVPTLLNEYFNFIYANYNSVYIKFEMGDLDIAPSREELSYDDVTTENIIRKLVALNDSIKTPILELINGMTNIRDVQRFVSTLSYNMSRCMDKVVWKGNKIENIVGVQSKHTSELLAYFENREVRYANHLRQETVRVVNESLRTGIVSKVNLYKLFSYNSSDFLIVVRDKKVTNKIIFEKIKDQPRNVVCLIVEGDSFSDFIRDLRKVIFTDNVKVMHTSDWKIDKKAKQKIENSVKKSFGYKILADGTRQRLDITRGEFVALKGLYVYTRYDRIYSQNGIDMGIRDYSYELTKLMEILGVEELYVLHATHRRDIEKSELSCACNSLIEKVKEIDISNLKFFPHKVDRSRILYSNIQYLLSYEDGFDDIKNMIDCGLSKEEVSLLDYALFDLTISAYTDISTIKSECRLLKHEYEGLLTEIVEKMDKVNPLIGAYMKIEIPTRNSEVFADIIKKYIPIV